MARDSRGRFIKGSGSGSSGVKVKDRGWNAMARNVARSPKVSARVGIQGPEAEIDRGGGLTNAGLASIHEFGSPARNIPERSFMRSTFDEKQRVYQKELDRIAGAVLGGVRLEGEMLLLGEQYRADVIGRIHSNIPPPLQPATVDRKQGEATALIDTGQMINSIRAVVVKG